jgi:hypothetical protein
MSVKPLLHQVLETKALEVSDAVDIPKVTVSRIRRGRRIASLAIVASLIIGSVVAVTVASQVRTRNQIPALTTTAPSLRYVGKVDLDPERSDPGPFVYSVASNSGYFYINRGHDIVRFDPTTSEQIPLRMPAALRLPSFSTAIEDVAVGRQGLWILHSTLRGSNQRLALSLVDFNATQVLHSILLPRTVLTRGHADRQIVVDGSGSAVWAVNGGLGYGQAIFVDGRSYRILRSLPIGSVTQASLAVGSSGAWFATQQGIVHFSRSGVALGLAAGARDVYQIASDGESLWATTGESGDVLQIDGTTNRIKTRTHLTWPSAIAVAHGAIWALEDSETIVRLDPKTGRVTSRYDVPGGIRGPASMSLGASFLVITSMNDARALYFSLI